MKFTPLELDRLKNINPDSVDREAIELSHSAMSVVFTTSFLGILHS